MRVGVLQAHAGTDVEANLGVIDDAARDAAGRGVDLLVTPELFPTGYAPGSVAPDDRILPATRRTAQATGVALVISEPHDGAITAVVLGGDGEVLGRYVKTHLWGPAERAAFVAGDGARLVVPVGGLPVGVAVCYDVEFPEVARDLALAGAGVLAVPTALDDPTVARVLVPARAYENRVAVAYANHVGPGFAGESVIVGPDGVELARAGAAEHTLLVAEVGPDDLERARRRVDYLADRRPETYRGLTSDVASGPSRVSEGSAGTHDGPRADGGSP